MVDPYRSQIKDRAAHAAVLQIDLLDRAQHADQGAFLQLVDAAQIRQILIIPRKKEK